MRRTTGSLVAGFALLDLSISIFIGSAILGGYIGMFSNRMGAQQDAESEHTVREARLALVSYAIANGRLPCPADPTIASGQLGAGVAGAYLEDRCEHGLFGAMPWTTLGLKELDAWGNRLAYRVAEEIAQTIETCDEGGGESRSTCLVPPSKAYASTPTRDALGVRELVWANGKVERTEPIANGLAAVVISSGPNGALSITKSGTKREPINTLGMEYELKNATPTSTTFYSAPADRRGPSCAPGTSTTECAFDDVVAWVSRGEILMALAKAGHKF